jgi:hypothetical protein
MSCSDPDLSWLDIELALLGDDDMDVVLDLPPAERNPINTNRDEDDGSSDGSLVYLAARHQPRHGPNRIPKGCGRDARANTPDKWDFYDYQKVSPGFLCLRELGYQGIVLESLWKVLEKIEEGVAKRGIVQLLTHRNRAAHRRKPCAFHWLDENWCLVEEIYKAAVREVLGDTSGLKPRGRKPKQTWASRESP